MKAGTGLANTLADPRGNITPVIGMRRLLRLLLVVLIYVAITHDTCPCLKYEPDPMHYDTVYHEPLCAGRRFAQTSHAKLTAPTTKP
jgi:hypothetical protein